MKKIILLFAATLGVTSLYAQRVWVKAGPEIGLNLSSIAEQYDGDSYSNKILPGLKIGGALDVGFTRHVSFQPGLYFSMKGTANRDESSVTIGNTTTTNTYKERFLLNYIEMPMNVEFKFGSPRYGQFYFGGGPYIAALLGGHYKYEHTRTTANNTEATTSTLESYDRSLSIGDNAARDDVRGFDGGLGLNMGYEFRNGLFLRGAADIGFANILPDGDNNNYMRNWSLGFSVGYFFHAR